MGNLVDQFLAEGSAAPADAQPAASAQGAPAPIAAPPQGNLVDKFLAENGGYDPSALPSPAPAETNNGPVLSSGSPSGSSDALFGAKPVDNRPWYQKLLQGSQPDANGYSSPTVLENPMAQKVQDYVAQNIDHGIRHNIAGQAMLIGAKATGLDVGQEIHPDKDPGLLSLGGVISAADPAALGIFHFAGAGVSAGLKAAGIAEKPLFMVSKAAADIGAENAAHSTYQGVTNYLKTAYAPFASKAAAGGALYGAAQETGNETLKGEPLSPSEILSKAAGVGLGALAFSSALAPFALAISRSGAVQGAMQKASGAAEQSLAKGIDQPNNINLGDIPAPSDSVIQAPKLPDSASFQDKVHQAYLDANEQASKMVSQHIIPEENAFQAAQKMMHDNLQEAGVTPAPSRRMPGMLGWVDWLTKSNYMDKMFGSKTTETAYNFVQGANENVAIATDLQNQFDGPLKELDKMGIPRPAAFHMLRHVEDMPDGSIEFNPDTLEVPGHYRPAWEGPIPSEQVLHPLRELRSTFTQTLLNNPEYAENVGNVAGYVPLMNKATGEIHSSTSTNGIMNPSFMQSRTEGMFNPLQHEDDLGVVLAAYSNKYAKFAAFNKHIPQLAQEMTKLQMLGQGSYANNLLAQSMDAMGIHTNPDAARVLGDKFMFDSKSLIQQLGQADPTGNLGSQLRSSLMDIFYSNTALANIPTIIKHALQPEFIGTAEMGAQAVAKGRALALGIATNPEASEAWEAALPLLKKSHNTSDMMGFTPQPQQNGTIKWATKVLSAPGIPGKYALNNLDTMGRKAMFLGGYDQASTALKQGGMDGMQKVMSGLGAGERQMVSDAYAKGGDKAAAQIYGSIRALRTMFAFGEANKADVFRNSALAQSIPFYSWGAQELSRVAGDALQGNYSTLTKRVAYPLAGITLFRTLTGRDIGSGGAVGAHPMGAITEPLTGSMNPAIGRAADFAKKGEYGAAATSLASNLSPYGPISRGIKRFDKSDGDWAYAIANLPKIKNSDD